VTWDPSKFVSFDCETHLISPGLLAPPLVCASYATHDGGQLLDKYQARDLFRRILDSDWIIVGANIAYDLLVMAVDAAQRGENFIDRIFAKYDRGEIYDVQIAEALHAVGRGHLGAHADGSPLKDAKGRVTTRYSLDTCVRLVLGRDNAKVNDRWRLRYHELESTPIAEWPEDARIYPVDDAVNTLEVALAQVQSRRVDGVAQMNLHDLAAQCRAAWALHLGAAWGFRVDGVALDALEAKVRAGREATAGRWRELGLLREDGSQDLALTRALVARAYGAAESCSGCGGVCGTCAGSGKVPAARAGKSKSCGTCKGDGRPRCDTCCGTGLALTSAVPRTEKEGIAYGRDALSESGDEDLIAFAEWSEDAKIERVYVPKLREGVSAPWTLAPNVLLDTGRASYSGVIQLLPREGGVRDCITARPGRLLVSCDYGGLELVTHAQSCLWLLGQSELARVINEGGAARVHAALAANMIGIGVEDFLERMASGDKFYANVRTGAKWGNFGYGGGMGAVKFVLTCRKQGPDTVAADGTRYKGLRFCILIRGAARCGIEKVTEWKERPTPPVCRACVECAEEMRGTWFDTWPENRAYFRLVAEHADRGWIEQHVSKRVRGGVTFTSAANGYFQGLAADGAKLALYRTSRECYTDRASALYGSRVILFAHDELIVEVPEDCAHEAAHRISEVMVGAMKEYVPDVAVTAPPALMRRWLKAAEPVYLDGRLVPWEPKAKAA
jgi:DNA polymerase-1